MFFQVHIFLIEFQRSRTTSSVEDVTKSGRDWVGEGAQPPFQELAVMMEPHRFKKPRTVKVNKTTEVR